MAERMLHHGEDIRGDWDNAVFEHSIIPMEKKQWVLQKKPETCYKTGELADEYQQARRQEQGVVACRQAN